MSVWNLSEGYSYVRSQCDSSQHNLPGNNYLTISGLGIGGVDFGNRCECQLDLIPLHYGIKGM